MEYYICKTCGVQHGATENPPANCIICDDERQFVGWGGQQWTTLEEMKAAGHTNEIRELEPGLTGIATQPSFAIGQRALLVQTPHGNVLWDCISYIDDDTISKVNSLGASTPYPLPTHTSTPRWWSGATPLAAPSSMSLRRIRSGWFAPIPRYNSGRGPWEYCRG